MAGTSFPSAPAAQDDVIAELTFDYAINETSIPFYYRWKCTYSRSWAANSGEWSLKESSEEHTVLKKLTSSHYLYVRLPSCKSSDYSNIQIFEFNLSGDKPNPMLVSAGIFDTCRELENKGRISSYKISKVNSLASSIINDWKMTDEEKSILNKIHQYAYVVLPIDFIDEQTWSQYPDVAELLISIENPITSKDFSKLFLSQKNSEAWKGILKWGNEFPWSRSMRENSTERLFAQAEEESWSLSTKNKRKQHFITYNLNESAPKALNIYGIKVGLNEEVYDPITKKIAKPRGNESCFYLKRTMHF
ncbi:hypothetical protein [Vibrio navarrensis]|uniref:hypothetical protein n=1 Tax=Vibrio navarrensis TaxID=29495 RepID=UPI0033902B49